MLEICITKRFYMEPTSHLDITLPDWPRLFHIHEWQRQMLLMGAGKLRLYIGLQLCADPSFEASAPLVFLATLQGPSWSVRVVERGCVYGRELTSSRYQATRGLALSLITASEKTKCAAHITNNIKTPLKVGIANSTAEKDGLRCMTVSSLMYVLKKLNEVLINFRLRTPRKTLPSPHRVFYHLWGTQLLLFLYHF